MAVHDPLGTHFPDGALRTVRIPKKLSALEERIGYDFADKALLKRAMTHASLRGQRSVSNDNERLEFLGDRVLALTIAAYLEETYPDEAEGELARRFNKLVRREACAAVARTIDLGAALFMTPSEADNGGRNKDTILADGCEALLGAVFKEAGFEVANSLVLRLWQPRLAGGRKVDRDAKSALQEWAQGQGLGLPIYVEERREGPDHAPRFRARVEIEGLAPEHGEGTSKRLAEQAAARTMLNREGVVE
ncbi:MAG: ribonuclease III [Hyphomicrobiaceae bacterium]